MADNSLDLESYKSIDDLKILATKQHTLLLQLKNEIMSLKDMNNDLKAQLLHTGKSSLLVSDEETICEMELGRLRDTSLQRTLTLEETKKFDILTKTLNNIKATKANQDDGKNEAVPVEKLLEIVVENEDK